MAILLIAILLLLVISFHKPSNHETQIEENLIPPEIIDVLKSSRAKPSLLITIGGFKNGSRIPVEYTCRGTDVSPEITIENIPYNTVSLAIILYDPDAPKGVFYHWLLYDIRVNGSDRIIVKENIPKQLVIGNGFQGINDFGRVGYNGPCPPPGKTHRYVFLVIALDKISGMRGQVFPREYLYWARGKVLAYRIYYGIYP